MSIFLFMLLLSIILGLLSLVYKKNFFLSVLLSLEVILLNIIMFNFFITIASGNPSLIALSVFIIALAAVEASLGISIITLISRNFMSNNITSLNLLKN